MNNLRKSLILGQILRRQMSGTVKEIPSSRFARLKEVQAKYGIEDGVPSFLKGGFGDRILYGATLLVTTVGLALSVEVLYTLSYPKKQE